MYEIRVKNNIKFFEIPALLSCEEGNLTENEAAKFKMYRYVILNFPALDFLVHKI